MYSYQPKSCLSFKAKKRLAIAGLVCLVVGIFFGVRYYKRWRAESMMEEANAAIVKLREANWAAENALENNMFLMTGNDEVVPLFSSITANKQKADELQMDLEPIQVLLRDGSNDEVRALLGADDSVTKKAQRYESDIRCGALAYCNGKRNSRDNAIWNEWFLKARLKKPIPVGLVERPDELASMPMDLYGMIPIGTDELILGLNTLTPEEGGVCIPALYNSLGANLLKHRPELEHIKERGKGDAVKARGARLYNEAMAHYLKVMPANDALSVFYRAEKHDGTYSMEAYKRLLAEQHAPVSEIQMGDTCLSNLTAYLNELHEQYFIYVSGHSKEDTRFRHTRSVLVTDSDGNTSWDDETYYTHGYTYYYMLTTEKPNHVEHKRIEVGEIDSQWEEWDYKRDEQVGWVRKWKRLHEDNTTILSGWKKDLKPFIEKE